MNFENIEYLTTRVDEEQKWVTVIYRNGEHKSEYTETYAFGEDELLEISAAAARATLKVVTDVWRYLQ